jgi:hypothetical protein
MSFETRPLNAKIRTGSGKGPARRTRMAGKHAVAGPDDVDKMD